MGRKKKFISVDIQEKIEKEILNQEVAIKEISNITQLPKEEWVRAYCLSKDDTLNACYSQYKRIYNHLPISGWLLTNSQNQKTLYLKIEKEDV